MPRSLEFSDLLEDLFIRGPYSVICLGKFPAHYSLLIDYICSWMGPAFAVRVEKPVTVNHSMIGILKQRKSLAAVTRRFQFLAQFLGLLMTVDTDRENL
jgi:hypothetical protein